VSSQPQAVLGGAPARGKIRCLLADEHVLMRQGVRRLLEDDPDVEVVAEACSISEVLQKGRAHKPDVVLVVAGLSGFSTVEAARLIHRDCPGVRLIFLGAPSAEEARSQTLVDVLNYVPKNAPAPRLISLVKGEHRGAVRSSPTEEDPGRLTGRQHEVLRLLAEGNTARKVASLLGVSVKTVEAHKFNLMRKLDIHNKAQLVTYAIQHDILIVPSKTK